MRTHTDVKLKAIILAICCALASFANAQSPHVKEQIIVSGDNNETMKSELDAVASAAGEDKLIIMIARLGTGEPSRNLSNRRLQSARLYLESTRGIEKQRIITAQGDRVQGLGRIEVYVNCRLFRIFTLSLKKNFAKEQ